jgi:endoribonuclease Dicer
VVLLIEFPWQSHITQHFCLWSKAYILLLQVLGDIVESCVAAVLLDSGFNLTYVWKLVLILLKPVLSFSDMHMNPMREIRELCQCHELKLGLPKPVKAGGEYHVKVEVNINSEVISCAAANQNSKVARKLAAQEALCKLKVCFWFLRLVFEFATVL